MKNFDVIIVGAGSIGVPTALSLSKRKLKVLVIEKYPSIGQGQNKSAIGGIRATHSDGAKIKIGLKSLEIFSAWQQTYGDDINWQKGGYLFPIYTADDKKLMTDLLEKQKSYGLNINWIGTGEVKEIVKGINGEHLLGGIYSPDDGNASPLLAMNAFYRQAKKLGVEFNFNETVTEIKTQNGKVTQVKTDKGRYNCNYIINCAGAYAREVGQMAGVDLPVKPDMHEGAITEPVEKLFAPMVVDIRQSEDAKNYYFYQNKEGQIVFCMTPQPSLYGTDRNATSAFLPSISKKMIGILPKLSVVKVRRSWRGLYPMTSDGFPIVDTFENAKGFISAVGMCGQGFMLAPGIGELVSKMITGSLSSEDKEILRSFSATRKFTDTEVYK
ncbi:MAG TPA: FAD-binding oxidoreductase [Elusimicrobiales bacterium]|nr:FAD-binding oxidoreductase [Elusimicrobiales bacterium]